MTGPSPSQRGCSEGFLNSELFSNSNDPNMGGGQKNYFPLFSSGGEVWHLLLLLLPSVSEEDLLPSPISAHLYHIHLFQLHRHLVLILCSHSDFSLRTRLRLTVFQPHLKFAGVSLLFCALRMDSESSLVRDWFPG